MSVSNFQMVKFLGKGSFGQVKLVRRMQDQKLYAMKEINVQSMKQRDREDQLNEIRILASIFHPNVLAYYETFIENGKLYIIIEYADAGDLDAEIQARQKSRRRFQEEHVWAIFLQCLNGLRELHRKRILHRDIKAQNILKFTNPLSNNEPLYKLADFGVSKVLHNQTDLAKTGIGTPYYISPEIWKNQMYNEKTDIFSLGCLMYELCMLKHPYDGRDMKDLSRNVLKGVYQPISEIYSVDLRQVIYKMLNQDPKKRPSVEQLLSSSFVQKYTKYCPTSLTVQDEEEQIGERTILQAGFNWQEPQLLKTINMNQQLSVAMNNMNRYGMKVSIADQLPSPAYQKRKEFELLQQIHMQRRLVKSQSSKEQEPITQPKSNSDQIKGPAQEAIVEARQANSQLRVNQQQHDSYVRQADNHGFQQQINRQYQYPYQPANNYQAYQRQNQPKPLQPLKQLDNNILRQQRQMIQEQQEQLQQLNQEYLRQKALQQQINYKQGNNYYQYMNRNRFDQIYNRAYNNVYNDRSDSRSSSHYSSRSSQHSNYPRSEIKHCKPQPFAAGICSRGASGSSNYSRYSDRYYNSRRDSVSSSVHGYYYDYNGVKRQQVCRPFE